MFVNLFFEVLFALFIGIFYILVPSGMLYAVVTNAGGEWKIRLIALVGYIVFFVLLTLLMISH